MTNDFDTALQNFLDLLKARDDAYMDANSPHLPDIFRANFTVMTGRKYLRIVKADPHKSAFCFIDRATGNILKAAGWNAPAKHARGNIFNDNPLKGTSLYGAAYLK